MTIEKVTIDEPTTITITVNAPDGYGFIESLKGDVTTHLLDDKGGMVVNCLLALIPLEHEVEVNPRADLIAQCKRDEVDYPEFWWELWQWLGVDTRKGEWVVFTERNIICSDGHEYQRHPHAESIILFHACSDADKARWEWRCNIDSCDCEKPWVSQKPTWSEKCIYRQRPHPQCQVTLENGIVWMFPEPVREALTIGQLYFVAGSGEYTKRIWSDDDEDNLFLLSGLIHLTGESANYHLAAMQAINNQQAK